MSCDLDDKRQLTSRTSCNPGSMGYCPSMPLRNLTFPLEESTATRIRKVTESERKDRLRLFDQKIKLVARRPASEVEAELEQVRQARVHCRPSSDAGPLTHRPAEQEPEQTNRFARPDFQSSPKPPARS